MTRRSLRGINDEPGHNSPAVEYSPRSQANRLATSVTSIAIFALLSRDILAGALRYFLDVVGVGALWFVPDMLGFVAFALWCAIFISARGKYAISAFFAALLLFYPILVGSISGASQIALLSGAKLLMPLILLGFARCDFFEKRLWKHGTCALLLLVLAAAYADQFMDFPWKGYDFEMFGAERDASRDWLILGQERISATSSSSSSLATSALLAGVIFSINCGRIRWKLVGYLITYVIIDLSTSRTQLVGLAACAAVDMFIHFRHVSNDRDRHASLARCLLIVIILLSALVPFYLGASRGSSERIFSNSEYSSLGTRASLVWPATIITIETMNGWFTGLGFGWVGAPAAYMQRYISPQSAVDNMFMYYLVIYGLFAFALLFLICRAVLKLPTSYIPAGFAIATLSATMSTEGAAGGILFSILIIGSFRRQPRE
jgi:hypothetical protein